MYFHHLYVNGYDITKFVFIDESHVDDRSRNRIYGYARRGEVATFRYIVSRGQRYTLAAAVGFNGVIDYIIIEGSCTATKFFRWFVSSLYFALEHDSVLVLDNARIHHYQPFLEIAEFLGVRIVFLPPYSPHLNPVENLWAAIKALIRRYRDEIDSNPVLALGMILEHYRDFPIRNILERMGYGEICELDEE